jgi:hypothetical protein
MGKVQTSWLKLAVSLVAARSERSVIQTPKDRDFLGACLSKYAHVDVRRLTKRLTMEILSSRVQKKTDSYSFVTDNSAAIGMP